MWRLGTPAGFLTVMLPVIGACVPEATAPQGASSIGARVVPIAVPDVWCPATRDSTAPEGKSHDAIMCSEQWEPTDSTLTRPDSAK